MDKKMTQKKSYPYIENLLVLFAVAIHGLFLRFTTHHFYHQKYEFTNKETWGYFIFQIITLMIFLTPMYFFNKKIQKIANSHFLIKINQISYFVFWTFVLLIVVWLIFGVWL